MSRWVKAAEDSTRGEVLNTAQVVYFDVYTDNGGTTWHLLAYMTDGAAHSVVSGISTRAAAYAKLFDLVDTITEV